jgi:hypothetical protein
MVRRVAIDKQVARLRLGAGLFGAFKGDVTSAGCEQMMRLGKEIVSDGLKDLQIKILLRMRRRVCDSFGVEYDSERRT